MKTFTIAGVMHSQFDDVKYDLWKGSKIDYKAESENPYDSNAIALYFQGQKIGYVPRNTLNINAIKGLKINRLNLYDETIVGAEVAVEIKNDTESTNS